MDDLEQHTVPCQVCGKDLFGNNQDLQDHMMNHHLGLKFNCGSCTKSFRSRPSLEKHCQDTHPIDDSKCQGSVNDSDSEDDLQEPNTKPESKRLSNGSFEAYDMCDSMELGYFDDDNASEEGTDNAFVKSVESEMEEKEDTIGEPGFNCQICADQFEAANDLKDHYLYDHLKVKYDCKLCNAPFATQKELSKHQKINHFEYFLKNKGFFYCHQDQCNWWSAQNASVVKHMIFDHLPILHQCHGCQQTFSSNSKLDLHKKESSCVQPTKIEINAKAADQVKVEPKPDKTHLEQDQDSPKIEQVSVSDDEGIDDSTDNIDKGKNCQICHKPVPNLTKHYLVKHLFWKIDCYYCGEIFTSFAHLVRHRQHEHKGMPSAQACHLCQAKFTKKNALVTHLLTVHLKLEFQCKICGRNYNSQSNLGLHMHLKHE